jgi:hypothetical protein
MAVQVWRGHGLDTRNSYESASNATEVVVASGIASLEHVHHGADETVAVFDQLAIARKVESLEEQTETGLHENLIAVEAEGETKLALVKELYDLDDMLASITNSYNSRRGLVAKVCDNYRAVD